MIFAIIIYYIKAWFIIMCMSVRVLLVMLKKNIYKIYLISFNMNNNTTHALIKKKNVFIT